ncbi:type III-A CRISPR-associated RAMP protein Csm5 (plasmid) [Nostoc sp. UHCC 0302]|uniref:type III-A CRISPR-associated RAMP protein Csm5 n=1 Tax=Nostoc sp. UHCC 0302 TaxID=3134896 RepID=UPI00311CB766
MVASDCILSKPEVYESKQIQLTSPMLHIGSAVSKLSPFEYTATSKRVYLPNPEVLARAFQQQGRMNEYIRRIENQEELNTLLQATFGDDWENACDSNKEPIFPKHTSSLRWTQQKITDLRPMIRNGFGQLYIPGSSIKGAIRTAIAYHLLKHADHYQIPKGERVSEIERRLRQKIGNLKQQAKFSDDTLFMNQLFTDFNLIYQERPTLGKVSLQNSDFMRAVQITDTEPLLENKIDQRGQVIYLNLPIVTEVIISSRFPDRKAKYRASIYSEMVRNVKTQFTISIDQEMLSWFQHKQAMRIPFNKIEDILNICKEFAQDQWDYEHDYWLGIDDNLSSSGIKLNFREIRNIYEPEECPHHLRFGWASGMIGTTVNLLFKDDLREQIRDSCGLKAPGFEAPKSRRIVVDKQGEIKYIPGWVKFKIL